MKSRSIVLLVCLLLASIGLAQTPAPAAPGVKSVTVYVEGDSAVIPKFKSVCMEMGPKWGLDFNFAEKVTDKYDYHVVLSTDPYVPFVDTAHGNITVLGADGKLAFTVNRGNRWTEKGTTNALTKEFVKVLARKLGTHK